MILDEAHKFHFQPETGGIAHDVYFDGEGPAVILMHELPGMNPQCMAVAARIVQWGFKVYVPLFFGHVGQDSALAGGLQILKLPLCIRHEFNLFHANKPSRIADWLRALVRKVDTDHPGVGVGVIGMCLTGNIVLSMMTEPAVKVPVMCEPALPFGNKAALGVPVPDIAAAWGQAQRYPILAFRFTTDTISPPERFCTLRSTFGDGVKTCEIETGVAPWFIPNASHPVLTGDYANQDDCNHPIQHVFDEILQALSSRLKHMPGVPKACPTP